MHTTQRKRNKREYSLKSAATADDIYKSKWPYYLLSFLNDNLQSRKTFLNLTVVDGDECAPSPASSVSSETNIKRPKPKQKVSKDHYSDEVQFKKYATDHMKKMTEQPDKETKTEGDNFCEMTAKIC